MSLKNINSLTILSKSSLEKIKAGGDPPDCDNIPIDLWKIIGCGKPIAPVDC